MKSAITLPVRFGTPQNILDSGKRDGDEDDPIELLYSGPQTPNKSKIHNNHKIDNKTSYSMNSLNCSKCTKSFSSQESYKEHMNQHKVYWCDDCKKGFQTRQQYELHMNKHKGIKFYCNYCGKSFSTPYTLKYHIQGSHASS